MEDFISKEFECRNSLASDNKIVNSIVDFLRTIDDKIEIENQNGKRVNAKSFIKMMGLDIKYGFRFKLYVYGNDKENNLKRIEDILEKKEFYTLEKIEELEKEQESEDNKLIEEEILALTPKDRKEIIKNDIEKKIKLLKEKRDTIHLESLNLDNNILYIKKDDDKREIFNVIDNNIPGIIKKLSSHYEIPVYENDIENYLSNLKDIVKAKDIKYFYIYLFFNNIKKYFYTQFDNLFIKKIVGIEDLHAEYNIDISKSFVDDAVKTFDFILEDKRKSADYSINIYMIGSISKSSMDIYRIINIVQNIGKIYEIKNSIIDNIADRIRGSYEVKSYINNDFEEYLENIKEFKDLLQKEFENIYTAKVLENDTSNLNIDYHNILRLARRL